MGIIQLQKESDGIKRSPLIHFRNWIMDALTFNTTKVKNALRTISDFNENSTPTNSESIVQLLSHSERNVRLAASESLTTYYFNVKNKKNYLELFDHFDSGVREGALNALSKLNVSLHPDYDPLSKLFVDRDEKVKFRAWSILTERLLTDISHETDDNASKILQTILTHNDPIVSRAVHLTVQRIAGKFDEKKLKTTF